MYVASVLYVPPEIIERVNKIIFSFLWPKKVHVKEKTIIAPVEYGGLRMPNFEYKVKACKVTWIKRLQQRKMFAHFAKVFGLPLEFEEMCLLNYDAKYLQSYSSPFYRQVLQSWYELKHLNPCSNSSDVRSQIIWYNKDITVDYKTVFIDSLYKKNLRYINDIVDVRGHFLNLDTLNVRYNCNINVMLYNSIKDAIPRQWRLLLKDSSPVNICMDLKVKVGNSQKKIQDISSKECYWTFINSRIEPPTAVKKWEEIYPDIDFNWEFIFCTPFITSKETSIRSLQYKIINRFFPCNYTLNKWYPNQSSACDFCGETDTIEHYFYSCKHVEIFWSSFFKWWHTATQMLVHLTCLDIIFGIHNPNSQCEIDSYNFCILLAKFFIHQQKQAQSECSFYQYQIVLKNRLECEAINCTEKGTEQLFQNQWSEIYDGL